MTTCKADAISARMLNVGCGNVWHPLWTNIDLVSHSPNVRAYDLTRGLPYADASFDVCYSSHVLEHLRASEADFFLAEQHRVLIDGGVIRVAVPDLEAMIRNYLQYLEGALNSDPGAEFRYDYTMLEIFDQTTREIPGGDLSKLWHSGAINDLDFVIERHGREAVDQIHLLPAATTFASRSRRILQFGKLLSVLKRFRQFLIMGMVRGIAGESNALAFQEGVYRRSGEIHRTMYDRFSLRRLLERAGFSEIRICRADESRIAGFSSFRLEVSSDGVIHKPDSLFVEGIKSKAVLL